jgi:hypothetical protein
MTTQLTPTSLPSSYHLPPPTSHFQPTDMADKMDVDAVKGEKQEETVQEVSPQRSTQAQPPDDS